MLRTKYVTDHKSKIIRAKRGIFGFTKVFLAWFFLSGAINTAVGLITTSWMRNCIHSNSQELNQRVCQATYRFVDGGTDLAGLITAGIIVSRKLKKDSEKRYENIGEKMI